MVSLAHRLFQLAGAVVLVLALVLTIGRSGAHAAEERRVALVVGVGAYQHLPRLDNTVRDAQLIADKLKATGFDVAIETEPSKNRLTAAVRDFARRVEAAGPDAVAVFYYAGHGVQDDKKTNFLIGADADLRSQVDLPVDALSLDTAMETLEAARPRLTFIVLDACRNSPLPQSAQRSANRGLAREDGRRALLMVFSTAPGDTAEDGPPGGHSPFASALARQLDVPGQESTQMFRAVMRAVSDESGDKQHVFMSNPLAQDFFFRPGAGAPPPPPPITVPQDAPQDSTPVRTEPTVAIPEPHGPDAPSFDCRKASTLVEHRICDTPALAARDRSLAYEYGRAILRGGSLQDLQAQEARWQTERDACAGRGDAASMTRCIDETYGQRTADLQRWPEPSAEAAPRRLSPPPPPASPSFNCIYARSAVEKLICSDAGLAAADRNLAAIYAAAGVRPGSSAEAAQAAWRRDRDACGSLARPAAVACVAEAYRERIATLGGGVSDDPDDAASARPSFNCARAGHPVEKLICATPRLARADVALVDAFTRVRNRFGASPRLNAAQSAWMDERNACAALGATAPEIACVERAYRQRTSELLATLR